MLSDKLLFRHSNSLVKDGIKLLCLGMLKLFYYKNQFSNLKKKSIFGLSNFHASLSLPVFKTSCK